MRWALLASLAFWALVILALAGCCGTMIEYRALPADMIPARPRVPTVKAEEFRSVPGSTDLVIGLDVYGRLARRNWLYEKHIAELRALLRADK